MFKPHRFNKVRKKQSFYNRAFLNDTESEHTGSIRAHLDVEKQRRDDGVYVWELYGGLEIRDCSRRIDLAFDGDTDEYIDQLQNSIEKYEIIQEVCEAQLKVMREVLSYSKVKNKGKL